MNKLTKGIAVLGLFIATVTQSHAAFINNGDFNNNCSLSGWNQDTDGDGDINSADFAINGIAPNCTADIHVGDWATSDAFFSNTLWQDLDLSGASDSTFMLSMDFSVDSDIDNSEPLFFADYLIIGLGVGSSDYFDENGLLGSLFSLDIDGFADFSLDFELNNSFVNQAGWSLEFQMNDTFDSFGSLLSISNVSITEVLAPVTDVPEPTSLAIFALGFAGLFSRRKLANELVRKSLSK